MKIYLLCFIILFVIITGNAEWAFKTGDTCPKFEIYKYKDQNHSSTEDIPGSVVLYAFGSIT